MALFAQQFPAARASPNSQSTGKPVGIGGARVEAAELSEVADLLVDGGHFHRRHTSTGGSIQGPGQEGRGLDRGSSVTCAVSRDPRPAPAVRVPGGRVVVQRQRCGVLVLVPGETGPDQVAGSCVQPATSLEREPGVGALTHERVCKPEVSGAVRIEDAGQADEPFAHSAPVVEGALSGGQVD